MDQFTQSELATLRAAVDTVIPADEAPGGWDGGVERLLREHGSGFLAWAIEPLRRAVLVLDAAAEAQGSAFATLAPDIRSALFADALASGALDELVTVAYQGYYGGTSEPAGWAVVGYRVLPAGVEDSDPDPITGIDPDAVREHYDVIVVGAGAGGGVAAAELAAAGRSVLLIERARPIRDRELRLNQLQGKMLERYDVIPGPGAGSPRVLENADGTTTLLPGNGDGSEYGLVAMTLGGGTRVWQGMSWRFYDEDFAMASIYGSPEGSTLVDWPFGYDELEPYYDRIEWEVGVSGDAASAMSRRTRRTRDYPMPALPDDPTRAAFSTAADRLGWSASPIPFSINSVQRDGRSACVHCAQCIGASCPVNAKNGTQNTMIPRALATGNCDLLMRSQVTRIEHDGRGRAIGVVVATDTPTGVRALRVTGDRIVVSAGAMETPRLLLASGLGNDWVGRNHHSHGLALAWAASGPSPKLNVGPGHSVASVDWVHRNGEAWGGGVLFDARSLYPLSKAELGRSLIAGYGPAHKDWMRNTPPPLGAMSMVQEVPHELSRVSIDPVITDRFGMPVARLRGESHPASRVASDYMATHAEEWVREIGGRDLHTISIGGGSRGGEHSAGTARMGTDPAMSATDDRGLLWGTRNVYVADASLHPTNGGFNPALTAMANALRVAALIVQGD